jgi:hypothetical protein
MKLLYKTTLVVILLVPIVMPPDPFITLMQSKVCQSFKDVGLGGISLSVYRNILSCP